MNGVATGPGARVWRIDAALPQTQCTRCGFPDCLAYAQAVDAGEAGINQCPPGGQEGIERLAQITGQPVLPLNPEHGVEGPLTVAYIDEDWCIGCTLCIKACPTDAIIGSNKHMHTVIEAHCTGCELCIPACPVDCIELEPVQPLASGWLAWSQAAADAAKTRYTQRQQRLRREAEAQAQRLQAKAQAKLADLAGHSKLTDPAQLAAKRAVIEAALARARSRKPPSA